MSDETNTRQDSLSFLPRRYVEVLKIATGSYRFAYQWRHDLYRLLWPFVLAEFVGIWGVFLSRVPNASPDGKTIGQISLVMALVILIPLAARVQRFALDPRPVERWENWQFGKDEGLILWAMMVQAAPILLSFIFFGSLIVIIAGPSGNYYAPLPLFLAFLIALSISLFLSRLLIIYPAALAEGRPALRKTWALTRGNYLRLLFIFGVSTVPFRLVFSLTKIIDNYVWTLSWEQPILKSSLYLIGVLIPSTAAAVGWIVMTFIAITLAYSQISSEREVDSGNIASSD
jgi:hypothetical protein